MSRIMKKIPVYRIGWRDAVKIIKSGGRLEYHHDGHADVIGPVKGSGINSTGGCVEGYLTAESAKILKEQMTCVGISTCGSCDKSCPAY